MSAETLTAACVRSVVLSTIEQVAAEHSRVLAPLSDDLPLLASGLDSLCFAILVARLEDALGADPFSGPGEAPLPVTVGDLVRAYERAAA